MGLHCTGQDVRLVAEPVLRKRACAHALNEWPLVAREAELNDIANMVTSGCSVFLVGEAGVGKSRLLRAALDRAASKALVAQVAAAHESAASIFPLLHEWLGLHTSAERDPGLGHPAKYLEREVTGRKIILGIDDAHLLHPDVVASLYQLATFDRVTLIITVRPSEPTPEGISKLWLDRLAERIEIKPFTRSAVGEVLSAKLGSHVDVETVERMQMMTGGNALLLMELVDHAIAEGSLRPVGGIWRWAGFLPYIEGRLVEVVRSRLGDLRPDEAELIHMAALAESLEINLAVVSELTHAAESLNRRGVIVAERCGVRLNVRLAYPLYRHVVAATMPTLTAHRLRLRLRLTEAGRLTEASRTLSEARVFQDQTSLCPMDVDGADLESAVVLAQTGQRDRAAILARKVAERCATAGRLAQAISALHLAARVGHARFVVDRCAQLASSVHSAVLQARADHVLALANDDADALVEIGDRFAQFGMRSLAAEAAAQSCIAYRKARRLHSARIAAARCHRLLTSYNIRLPAWVAFDTTPADGLSLGLTAREHEIAGYAVTGLSNREIADRLTVSVRTVENHLQRTYNKLGISTRSDLILSLDPRVSSSPGTINGAT